MYSQGLSKSRIFDKSTLRSSQVEMELPNLKVFLTFLALRIASPGCHHAQEVQAANQDCFSILSRSEIIYKIQHLYISRGKETIQSLSEVILRAINGWSILHKCLYFELCTLAVPPTRYFNCTFSLCIFLGNVCSLLRGINPVQFDTQLNRSQTFPIHVIQYYYFGCRPAWDFTKDGNLGARLPYRTTLGQTVLRQERHIKNLEKISKNFTSRLSGGPLTLLDISRKYRYGDHIDWAPFKI